MSIPCCVCESMETAQSHGDDTHAVATRQMWAREHGLRVVVSIVGGLRAWLIDRFSNRDAGECEIKTASPCGE